MKCIILPIVLLAALATMSNAATKQNYVVSIYQVEMDSATTTPVTVSTTPTTATTTPTTATTTPTTVTTTPTTVTTTPTTATTTPTTATTTPTTATTTPTTATTTPTTATTTPTTATTTPTTATTTPTTATTTPTTATTTPTTATTTATTATTTPTTATTTPTTATTTPTTATTTPTTDTTTVATTAAPTAKHHEAIHVRHPREIKMAGHTYTPVCSGTIIGEDSVITTITCAKLAVSTTDMPMAIRTAQYDTANGINTDMFYEVREVFEHPGYNEVSKINNIAILKLKTPFSMTGEEENKVKSIYWKTSVPDVDTLCVGSYWAAMGAQKNIDMKVKACSGTANPQNLCAGAATTGKACVAGQDGGVLECGGEVAGVFYPSSTAMCDSTTLIYQEVSKDKEWIWDTVNAAPVVHLSLTALLAMIVVAITNHC